MGSGGTYHLRGQGVHSMNKIGVALLAAAGLFVGGLGFMIAGRVRSDVASLRTERRDVEAAMSNLRAKLDAIDRKLDRGTARPANLEPFPESSEPERTSRSERAGTSAPQSTGGAPP